MLRRRGRVLSGGMRRPVLWAGTRLTLAAAMLLLAGCGGMMATPTVDSYEPVALQPRPVADLSAGRLNLANFFMGFGVGQLRPDGSSLEPKTVYDVSMVLDAPPLLSFELLVGLWDLPDRPVLAGGFVADSELKMMPVLFALQIQKEYPKFRVYFAPGVGYSFNNYELGANHKAAMLAQYSATSYSVDAEDGLLLQGAVGFEFYSSESADLNFGLELRYLRGDLDIIERPDGVDRSKSVDLEMWLIRGMVTWHF